MKIEGDTKIKISKEVAVSKIGEEAVLLNLKTGKYFQLNEEAVFAIENMRSYSSLNQLQKLFINTFDVDEKKCREDLSILLDFLIEKELLSISEN